MEYISTRGDAEPQSFETVLLKGLAPDGGLYVPRHWPELSSGTLASFQGQPYRTVAARVLKPFVGDCFDENTLKSLIDKAYEGFDHHAVTPLVQVDQRVWMMELFHGQTLAFKDVALQLLGAMFDHVLARRGERITVIGATSGDTGSAAIEACRDRENVDIFILHPKGRTSNIQRRQMTTVDSPNVHNIAIEGTFDDCQDLVKGMFQTPSAREDLNLSAINSINWARIMAQIVYYVVAAASLGAPSRPVSFAVPTGNFGNVYAAYAARSMGVPIERLIVGTNTNDILDRFFQSGAMEITGVVPTDSPSMDIQVSSNFERFLFDLMNRDGSALAEVMERFRRDRSFAVTEQQLDQARGIFASQRADDEITRRTIATCFQQTGMLIDPHTAVGLHAAWSAGTADSGRGEAPVVALACAHPAKFPDAVRAATGVAPQLPDRLADLERRPEHYATLPNDPAAFETFVRERARRTG